MRAREAGIEVRARGRHEGQGQRCRRGGGHEGQGQRCRRGGGHEGAGKGQKYRRGGYEAEVSGVTDGRADGQYD